VFLTITLAWLSNNVVAKIALFLAILTLMSSVLTTLIFWAHQKILLWRDKSPPQITTNSGNLRFCPNATNNTSVLHSFHQQFNFIAYACGLH